MPTEVELANFKAAIPAAQSCAHIFGVPASVTLAQWIVESSWGTSELAVKAKNFFGIKAEHLNNPSTYEEFPTHEYVHGKRVLVEADFERYDKELDSFLDHGSLLARAPRYAAAMAVAHDPFAFAAQLQHGGYSTAPDYATMLAGYIREYNLTQYDPLPPAVSAAQEKAA